MSQNLRVGLVCRQVGQFGFFVAFLTSHKINKKSCLRPFYCTKAKTKLGEKLDNILRKKMNMNNKTDRNSCQRYQKNCQTPKK